MNLVRASLVFPRGGSRTPQVVVTAAREGGLVSKVESWRRGKFERKASPGFHLCKPWDDAVSGGLDHCLLSVDLLLRWSLSKLFFIIPISVVVQDQDSTNYTWSVVTCSSDIVY